MPNAPRSTHPPIETPVRPELCVRRRRRDLPCAALFGGPARDAGRADAAVANGLRLERGRDLVVRRRRHLPLRPRGTVRRGRDAALRHPPHGARRARADVGIHLRPFGSQHDDHPAPPAQGNPFTAAFSNLARAATTRTFWFLFTTFFICGFTTNGLVGTHQIAFCSDHGIVEVQAASLLALMGFFDLFGTTFSGWLTDRFDPRKLLFFYYGLRGLSLIYLPYSDFSLVSLSVFAVFYGLDWIATVPPTVRIANEAFGDQNAPLVFGWVVAGHQLGAACAAFFSRFVRSAQGDYMQAFIIAGATGIVAAVLSLMIGRRPAQPVLLCQTAFR